MQIQKQDIKKEEMSNKTSNQVSFDLNHKDLLQYLLDFKNKSSNVTSTNNSKVFSNKSNEVTSNFEYDSNQVRQLGN